MIKKNTTLDELVKLRETLDPLSQEWQEVEEKIRRILQDKYKDEHVLVINQDFMPQIVEKGFTPVKSPIDHAVIDNLRYHAIFMPRYKVEYNPTFKQIIPYVIAVAPDSEIFTMIRTKGDPRLVGKASVGIGGHINPVDENSDNVIMAGLDRELHEEICFGDTAYGKLIFKGFIYDPDNLVGKDHLGLVYILELANKEIAIKEKDSLEGKFMKVEDILQNDKLETWSRIALESLWGK